MITKEFFISNQENILDLIHYLQKPTLDPYKIVEDFCKKFPKEEEKIFTNIGHFLIQEIFEPVDININEEGFLPLTDEEALKEINKAFFVKPY